MSLVWDTLLNKPARDGLTAEPEEAHHHSKPHPGQGTGSLARDPIQGTPLSYLDVSVAGNGEEFRCRQHSFVGWLAGLPLALVC